MRRYGKSPAVTYLSVSDDEVIARGGHLDGFSLIISDDTGRGLASLIVDSLNDGVSAEEIFETVSETHEITVEEIERFLEEMHESGVALRVEEERASFADWIAFARFGEVVSPSVLHRLVVVGSDVAAMLVERLGELGLQADHKSWDQLDSDDLSGFAVTDGATGLQDGRDVSQRADPDANEEHGLSDGQEIDVPTDEVLLTRLVVLADSGSLQALYDLNERAVAGGVPVFYLQVAGVEFAVGPYVVPRRDGMLLGV